MSLATFEDGNRWLDQTKIRFENASDAEPEVAIVDPIVKSHLIGAFPNDVGQWDESGTPESTPELVRTICGMLMASFRYAKKYSEETTEPSSYSGQLYAQAMLMLEQLRNGTLTLEDVNLESQIALIQGDFWPNNTTLVTSDMDLPMLDTGDPLRMFSMEQEF